MCWGGGRFFTFREACTFFVVEAKYFPRDYCPYGDREICPPQERGTGTGLFAKLPPPLSLSLLSRSLLKLMFVRRQVPPRLWRSLPFPRAATSRVRSCCTGRCRRRRHVCGSVCLTPNDPLCSLQTSASPSLLADRSPGSPPSRARRPPHRVQSVSNQGAGPGLGVCAHFCQGSVCGGEGSCCTKSRSPEIIVLFLTTDMNGTSRRTCPWRRCRRRRARRRTRRSATASSCGRRPLRTSRTSPAACPRTRTCPPRRTTSTSTCCRTRSRRSSRRTLQVSSTAL